MLPRTALQENVYSPNVRNKCTVQEQNAGSSNARIPFAKEENAKLWDHGMDCVQVDDVISLIRKQKSQPKAVEEENVKRMASKCLNTRRKERYINFRSNKERTSVL